MTTLTDNFTTDEMACPCCHVCKMSEPFMKQLQHFRSLCKFPFQIVSGYRCETHNKAIGGELKSKHLDGLAADIAYQDGEQLYRILKFAPLFFNGLGVNNGAVHVDSRPVPLSWTYYKNYSKKS